MDICRLLAFLPFERFRNPPPKVAVLRLAGVIGMTRPLRGATLTLPALADMIERAFSMRGVKAVALAINSPGGSAVQSTLIHRRIRDLATEKNIPVFAFAEDVAASGGYMLACAADEIHADASSIIGSIGVITAGFGFPALLERLGVERRLYTAGEHKAMLDPFSPENPDDVERLKVLQREIHDNFKELVRERRAGHLKADEEGLFSGEFWTGKRALQLGLIDGIGDLRSVMRQRYGDKVRLVVVGAARSWVCRRLGWSAGLGSVAADALALLEERVWWGRYGL